MEETAKELEQLFDEMLKQIPRFKRKTYADAFLESYEARKELFVQIASEVSDNDEEKILQFASAIPDHAEEVMHQFSKKEREKYSLNFNLTMVVYVIPMFLYTREPGCEKIADQMIELWNSRKITNMTIGKSDFEGISKGFKGKWCYITTAVCYGKSKPDDCYELRTLRRYRDEYLIQTSQGRRLVDEYYDIAPAIVLALSLCPDASKIYDRLYDNYLQPCVSLIDSGRYEECKELYMDMVTRLKSEYLYEYHE